MASKREPEQSIQEYLESQNRPYSVTDVFNNLHKEFGKTAVTKALETLAATGRVTEKTYGKQKVYAPSQDKYGDFNDEELKKYDNQIIQLQGTLSKLQQQAKQQEDQIIKLNSQLTTEEAGKKINLLESENEKLSARLNKLKSGTTLITKEERQKIYARQMDCVKQWRKRKRMAMDVVDAIMEGYPKSKKQFVEEAGIETDEEAGVKLPS